MATIPRLLVFIPTYRRPEALMRQLAALESLRKANPRVDIDIQVSHNESADSQTQLTFEGPSRHRFNPINLGADINIALAFTACDGYDFLWILSDDDFLSQDDGLPPLPFDKEFDLLVFDDAKCGIVETRQILASDLLNSSIGLISNVIYRVSSVRASLQESLNNVTSCFPHMSVIASAFAHQACCIRYLPLSPTFTQNPKYKAECVTDYSAARSGVLMVGKYLPKKEKRLFTFFYVRHADHSKLCLTGPKGSLFAVFREVSSLHILALPELVFSYILRKMKNYVKKFIYKAKQRIKILLGKAI
jgi:hypothetical protein